MRRVASVLAAVAALGGLGSGCGSAESLEFANGSTTYADAAEDAPYPDTNTAGDTAPADAAADDAGPPSVKCPLGKDGKATVCVRVVRASDGPSISADTKSTFGLDGRGALLVGLAAVKPTSRDASFVAQTWLPTESSGAGKFEAAELPKIAELSVAPGTYWAYAVFRDQEPYSRPGVAVGDYVTRLVELPQITVVAGMGALVDVRVHPVRAVDLEVKLGTTPTGSGSGPVGAWLLEDKKIVGEGRTLCAELAGGKLEVIRVFTTYTGTFNLGAALFDFNAPLDDASGLLPTLPPGTLYSEPATSTVKIAEGDWLAPDKKRLALDKSVPLGAPKPTDAFPSCASYAIAPPM